MIIPSNADITLVDSGDQMPLYLRDKLTDFSRYRDGDEALWLLAENQVAAPWNREMWLGCWETPLSSKVNTCIKYQ